MVLQDVQTNATVGVDIRVIDSGGESALGWLERVISWEVDIQDEHSTGEGTIVRSHDGGLPVVLVLLVNWSGRAVCGGILPEVDKFFLDSLKGHLRN